MHGCGDQLRCCMLKHQCYFLSLSGGGRELEQTIPLTIAQLCYSSFPFLSSNFSPQSHLPPFLSATPCLLGHPHLGDGGRGQIEKQTKTVHNSLNSSKYTFVKKGDATWLFMKLIQISSSWKQVEILNLVYVLNWDKSNNSILPRTPGLTPLLLHSGIKH